MTTLIGTTVVVMGVSGAGKSTVAEALAHRLGRAYLDADDLHSPANRAKLSAGVPLDDADRAPWLDAVGAWVDGHPPAVIACSALRRRYRDRLRAGATPLWFVHLDPPAALLAERLTDRQGHFMSAALLPDQLATLEPLAPDEAGVRVAGGPSVDDVVEAILAALTSGYCSPETVAAEGRPDT